ncbi:RHS repeat-associated core domain-containing protein [Marinobacterium rhizophilum]|uniref:RHS repeat-associated core domain-containing protein n=1 Tax=Marinobacterium rhizophilum TaxID=420402 RepID=UPI0009FF7ADD|nr:RHS repeat-associated core domain-containing protein [Marinobacterium rhizophilum]
MDWNNFRLLVGVILLVLSHIAGASNEDSSRQSNISSRYGVFQEPLVAFTPFSRAQHSTLDAAAMAYSSMGSPSSVGPVSDYLDRFTDSPWRASLLLNMALARAQAGYFSDALQLLEQAHIAAEAADNPAERAVAARILGELLELHTRFGHRDAVEALLKRVSTGPEAGSISESLTFARAGLWQMKNEPEKALRCGIAALDALLAITVPARQRESVLENSEAGADGTTLAQLDALADGLGLDALAIRRGMGQPVPVPSLVHWRVGHYATILSEDDGVYRVRDPAYGQDLWISQDALDAESSGYFLALNDVNVPWQRLKDTDAAQVVGSGYTSSSDQSSTSDDDLTECDDPCTEHKGMPRYRVHSMLVSLNIRDTPIGYTPPVGPSVPVTLTYSQREINQPTTFTFSNLGQKWTFNWLSYVQDDPQQVGNRVMVYLPGGGSRNYGGYNVGTGAFLPEQRTGAQLVRVSSLPLRYERRMPDGRRFVYAQPDNSAYYPRRVMLSAVIDPAGNAVTLQYDAQQRLLSVTDALDQITVFTYDNPSNPLLITGVTDPFGRNAIIGYDVSGRLNSITDAIGMTSTFGYDSGTFVNTMNTPYGTTSFSYGESGTTRWLEVTDPQGERERVEFAHGASGIPFSDSPIPAGMNLFNRYINGRNTFYWDKEAMRRAAGDYTQARIRHWYHLRTNTSFTASVLESVKNPLERRVWFNYPGQSWAGAEGTLDKPSLVGRVLPDGTTQLSRKTYNVFGNVTSTIDPQGRELVFDYADNQVDLVRIQRRSAAGYDVLAQFTYNDQHRPLTYTDSAGQVTTYDYNAAGQLTRVINPLGHVSRYEYDDQGYLTGIIDPNGNRVATYSYDAFGRIDSETNAAGYRLEYRYDALDRRIQTRYPDGTSEFVDWDRLDVAAHEDRYGNVTQFAHDAVRNLLSEIDPSGHQMEYDYFANGALKSRVDGLGNTSSLERDIQRRVVRTIRADGSDSRRRFDSSGRPIRETDALGADTEFGYATDDRLASVTDPNGNSTLYRHDAYTGQLVERDSPDSGVTTYRYDSAGNLTGQTDANGQATTYEYDALNRVIRTVYADGQVVEYLYDAAPNGMGRLAEVRDATGRTVLAYDVAGNPVSRTQTSPDGVELKTQYAYNDANQLARVIYPSGAIVDYSYAQNRLTAIAANGQVVLDDIHYAAFGAVTGWNWGNGQPSSRTYDANGRLDSFNIAAENRQLSYDKVGNIVAINGGSLQRNFAYDAKGRLNAAMSADWDLGYTYDPNGNRTHESSDGVSRYYAVDPGSNRLLTAEDVAFIYDGNGNTLTDGRHSYQYDARNRLATVDDGFTGDYQYNASGQRVYKMGHQSYRLTADLNGDGEVTSADLHELKHFIRNGQSPLQADLNQDGNVDMHDNACIATQISDEKDDPGLPRGCRLGEWIDVTIESRFVYAGPQLLGEYDIDGRIRQEIVWMGTMPVAVLQDGEIYQIHSNQIDAPEAITDAWGTVVWRWTPKPFGDSLADEDPDGNGQRFTFNLRFPGQYFDAETGLNYNYYRDYDPATGRYIESDPIGLAGGLNTYVYVGGNPPSYVDPLGLLCGKGSHLIFDFRRGFSCELDPPPSNPDAKCITVECVMRNGAGRDTRKNPICPVVCRVAAMPCQMLGSIISPSGAACRGAVGVVCSAVCDEDEKEECK